MFPRIMAHERHMLNLAQKIYKPDDMEYEPREEAHAMLVKIAKQDFGYDVNAWVKWFKENTDHWDEFGIVERALKEG